MKDGMYRFKTKEKLVETGWRDEGWLSKSNNPGVVISMFNALGNYVYVMGNRAKIDNIAWNVSEDMFELEEDNDLDSMSLEQLVAKANEWAKVREKLKKYQDQVEAHVMGEWENLALYPRHAKKYRIKESKKEFPLKRIAAWDIQLAGDTIRIGCAGFKIEKLYEALERLCNGTATQYMLQSKLLRATRNSIHYCGNCITWEEADRLLDALKQYLNK